MDLDDVTLRALTPEFLAGLPDEALFALADAVEARVGSPVLKDGDRLRSAELRLARDLEADWAADVTSALDAELRDLPESPDPGQVGRLLDRVDARLRGRSWGSALGILTAALGGFWVAARRTVRAALGVSRPGAAVHVGVSLARADRAAISALSGQQTWWIGEFWSRHLSTRILETVRREALVAGLGREQVGRILRGAVSGEFPLARVPNTFRGSPEAYFRQLAGDVRSRGSNFGFVTSYREAGIERYRIEATVDERTTEICLEMNGRTFLVSEGVELMERLVGADSPEDVKSIAGWRTVEEIREMKASNVNLASAGLALPPYHANCRTVTVPD